MNIVILAGGTGSIALQTGLYRMIDTNLDGFDTKVIVNAYDNGLSTGAVRQVMNGKILGPSDVRKNQTTRLQLENPNSPWLKFLNIRFTQETSKVEQFCKDQIASLADELTRANQSTLSLQTIHDAIEEYFKSPIASKIDYNDFSLANIIYAGLAKMNDNSLRAAAKVMARAMGIKDNVILNDDTSLFLGAITKSGKRITDEGDIVSWGRKDDPFVDVFFTNHAGTEARPVLCTEAARAIANADLIILSSGTQWSSLIPTYASIGFREAIDISKAKIVMVMNRQPDHDSPGQTAGEIIDLIVPKYFPKGRLNVIVDDHGHPNMSQFSDAALAKIAALYRFNMVAIGSDASRTHDPRLLAQAVAEAYFGEYLNSDFFVFDYDDTLVGRGNVFPISSKFNVGSIAFLNNTTNVAICTGNSIKALKLRGASSVDPINFTPVYKNLLVYADGGANKYWYNTSENVLNQDDAVHHELIAHINPKVTFTDLEVDIILSALRQAGIPGSKIENRGNAIIAIKPIDSEYRDIVLSLVDKLLESAHEAFPSGTGYNIFSRAAGRTTIEIVKDGLSKVDAISNIQREQMPKSITYVGDEFEGGNDAAVAAANFENVKCLPVSTPAQTAFFLMTLKQAKRGQ